MRTRCSMVRSILGPRALQGDQTFNNGAFKNDLCQRNVDFHSSPSRPHSKKLLVSKHGVIMSNYLRLRATESPLTPEIATMQALRISNKLYGRHQVPAFAFAPGFTRILMGQSTALPQELCDVHVTLQANASSDAFLHPSLSPRPRLHQAT